MEKYDEIYEEAGGVEEEKVAATVLMDTETVAEAVKRMIGFQIERGGKVLAEKKKRQEAMEEAKKAAKGVDRVN